MSTFITRQILAKDNEYTLRPKEKICVFPVTSPKKIRVGRSLLILFFIFQTQQMCCLHEVYNEKGSFWGLFTYNTEWMSYC